MRKSGKVIAALAAAAFGLVGSRAAQAGTVITQWSFTGKVAAPDNSPAPTTGTGATVSLGMTNTYTYANGEGPGSATSDDITQPGSSGQLQDYTWRIRGNSNAANSGAGMANGWNNSAPNYTQGAEFQVPTTGYQNIGVSFDWYCTTQGVANMQFLYTLDDTQATPMWVAVGSDLIATANNFYGAATSSPTNAFDLSSIAGAANDPNFAFEMVSVQPIPTDANYSSTDGDGDYAAASGGNYNNSSGNWSFGNITVSGTSVPEPTALSLVGLAGLGLLRRRRTT